VAMNKTYFVAIFTDSEFAGLEPHQTEECADAYAEGVKRGADEYNGECHTYVLPRDIADMRSDGDDDEFVRAMAAYAAEVERHRVAEERDE
jgi:hypothetical protein